MLTDEELARYEAVHYSDGDTTEPPWCVYCSRDWPCPTSKLVAEVRRLRAQPTEPPKDVEFEWGTLLPSGNVCKWPDEDHARRQALVAQRFDPPHPLVRRAVSAWSEL